MTEDQRAVLELERRFANQPTDGRKDRAIAEELGLTPTRYHQRLNALLSSAAALEHDPVLVNRLRRLRASRVKSKSLR